MWGKTLPESKIFFFLCYFWNFVDCPLIDFLNNIKFLSFECLIFSRQNVHSHKAIWFLHFRPQNPTKGKTAHNKRKYLFKMISNVFPDLKIYNIMPLFDITLLYYVCMLYQSIRDYCTRNMQHTVQYNSCIQDSVFTNKWLLINLIYSQRSTWF